MTSLSVRFGLAVVALFMGAVTLAWAADPEKTPEKPVLKITPGQVIIPTDRMQRPWGELVSLDRATRTGKFRREGNDEVVEFTVMPYAELLHHATHGDLQDFRVGERAIFRLHENAEGKWTMLTYIQDEMNMMHGHKEYFYADAIDAAKGQVACTQANADQSFVREKGILIETDKETRFWKAGQPAQFADIQVGGKLRTKTHGAGQGKRRIAWEVFLDDESLLKFQAEQLKVHSARILEEGAPGYTDTSAEGRLELTLFQEGEVQVKKLKAGKSVKVAPAGVDRKPVGEPIQATVAAVKMQGRQCKVTLETGSPVTAFKPTELVRVWAAD